MLKSSSDILFALAFVFLTMSDLVEKLLDSKEARGVFEDAVTGESSLSNFDTALPRERLRVKIICNFTNLNIRMQVLLSTLLELHQTGFGTFAKSRGCKDVVG